MKYGILLWCLFAVSATTTLGQDQHSSTPDWTGTWQGKLLNLPERPNAPSIEVIREIGVFPSEDDTCTVWRTTYKEGGEVRQVKDYKLCRGTDPDDLFVDEGDDIKLTARWMGDVLVTPFKYDDTLIISTTRVLDGVMWEEHVSMKDQPAIEGIQTMKPGNVQRLVLEKVD